MAAASLAVVTAGLLDCGHQFLLVVELSVQHSASVECPLSVLLPIINKKFYDFLTFYCMYSTD